MHTKQEPQCIQDRNFRLAVSLLLLTAVMAALPASAHSINYALEKAGSHEVAWFYFRLGITHIIPLGADHILFVAGLCLLSTGLRPILWQATAFTLAHSITLGLSMKNIIVAPGEVVEPIIALSILFVAVENLLLNRLRAWRILVVFSFGLIHGMGFASVLNETGLPPERFLSSILFFNLGVEAGQVAVIVLVFLLLIMPFREKPWYKRRILYPVSTGIALIAVYWTLERMFS